MKRAVFRYVEAELYDYPFIKRELEDLRAAIIEEGPDPGKVVVGREKTRFTDPTYTKAQRLLTNRRLSRMEDTVRAIEEVLGRLSAEKRRLVELKYFQGRLSNLGVADALNVSLRTFYYWRGQIVRTVAVEMGLVDVTETRSA